MLVGVQRLCRVFIVAIVGSHGASTILRFSSPLSFVIQAFLLDSLLFNVPPLHSFDISLMLLFDPGFPFFELHQIGLNRLLRLMDIGFESRVLVVRVVRKSAQD